MGMDDKLVIWVHVEYNGDNISTGIELSDKLNNNILTEKHIYDKFCQISMAATRTIRKKYLKTKQDGI